MGNSILGIMYFPCQNFQWILNQVSLIVERHVCLFSVWTVEKSSIARHGVNIGDFRDGSFLAIQVTCIYQHVSSCIILGSLLCQEFALWVASIYSLLSHTQQHIGFHGPQAVVLGHKGFLQTSTLVLGTPRTPSWSEVQPENKYSAGHLQEEDLILDQEYRLCHTRDQYPQLHQMFPPTRFSLSCNIPADLPLRRCEVSIGDHQAVLVEIPGAKNSS